MSESAAWTEPGEPSRPKTFLTWKELAKLESHLPYMEDGPYLLGQLLLRDRVVAVDNGLHIDDDLLARMLRVVNDPPIHEYRKWLYFFRRTRTLWCDPHKVGGVQVFVFTGHETPGERWAGGGIHRTAKDAHADIRRMWKLDHNLKEIGL